MKIRVDSPCECVDVVEYGPHPQAAGRIGLYGTAAPPDFKGTS